MALPTGTDYATADVSAPSSDLTDFSLLVDLSRLPQSWWDAVDTTDAPRGRAAKDDGVEDAATELAADWLAFDSGAQTGWVRVLWSGTLASTGGDTLRLYPPQAANSAYAATDTYGQYNAYDTDYGPYWPPAGGTDRTSNQISATAQGGVTIGGITGQVDTATLFDDTDDYIDADNATSVLDETVGAVALWLRRDFADSKEQFDVAFSAAASSAEADNNIEIFYLHTSDVLQVKYKADGVTSAHDIPISNVPQGTFTHVGITWDVGGDEVKVFLDGSQYSTTITGLGTWQGTLDLCKIGRDRTPSVDDTWDGALDEVQIHTAARPVAWFGTEYAQTNDQSGFWGAWSWEGESVTPADASNLLLLGVG